METEPPVLRTHLERMRDRIDWQRTAIVGGGAWLLGYVLSFVLVTVSGADGNGSGTADVATWAYVEGMGGLYEASTPWGDSSAIQLVYGTIDSNFWGVGAFLHYVAPAVVLIAAGYVLAGDYADWTDRPTLGDRFGAWVGGVSLVVVFGGLTFLAAYVMSPDGTSPEGLPLLLAAVVYPVVFAGIGAARRVGLSLASLRTLGVGLAGFVAAIALWNFVEDPIGAAGLGDLSGADEFLPYLGNFLVDHGVHVTPGQQAYATPDWVSGIQTDPGVVGSGVAWLVLLGPALTAAALIYREEITDPILGVGRGAQTAAGYLLGVTVLTLAVLGQRMNFLYDELYGTDTEEAVREELIQQANLMFGAILPDVVLVAGVLLAVTAGAIGGAAGAVVAARQQTDTAAVESTSASGAPQQAE